MQAATRCLLTIALFPAFARGAQGATDQEWSGTVRDSAGVSIVENPETGVWTEETRWTVEKDMSLGAAEGDSTQQFGQIVDVDAGSDGRIYVLDRLPVQTKLVHVFETDGTFARAFARNGQGPGEIGGFARGLIASDAGTILVADPSTANLFTLEGDYVASFRLHFGRALASEPLIDLAGGEYLQLSQRYLTSGAVTLIRQSSQGEVVDSVHLLTLPPSPPVLGAGNATPLLPARALWSRTTDGRIISGVSDRYRIEVRTRDGELERVITKPAWGRPLSREDRQAMVDRYLDQFRELVGDESVSVVPIAPKRLPAFTELAGGPEGTIWARGMLPIDSMFVGGGSDLRSAASSEWEVYSHEGKLLGRISLPPNLTLKKIRGRYIYGIESDEIVQKVVRLRILGPDMQDAP